MPNESTHQEGGLPRCRATRTGTLTRTQRSQRLHEARWRQGKRSRCAEEQWCNTPPKATPSFVKRRTPNSLFIGGASLHEPVRLVASLPSPGICVSLVL